MLELDLRKWLEERREAGDVLFVDGVDLKEELFALTNFQQGKNGELPALVFDGFEGYPRGFRVITRPIDSRERVAGVLGMNPALSSLQMIREAAGKVHEWEAKMAGFPPRVVKEGPILENVENGAEVNVKRFPAPQWNEFDGGPYIGTADAVFLRDPDTGEVNFGTYRIMVQDEKTVSLHISPGKHGRRICEKYHERGQACPVAISVGHHPLIFGVASLAVPYGMEYNYLGAIRGEAVEVLIDDITGLPIPAASEVVLTGFCPPGKTMNEGPFGEWTGHYADVGHHPVVEVERIYYRNDPILMGLPARSLGLGGACAGEFYFHGMLSSAEILSELWSSGLKEVQGVWLNRGAGQLFLTLSVKQTHAGFAKRAALLASQSRRGAYFGRYIVVVDEDIDPTDLDQVLWAMCFRSDPVKDLDILTNTWSTPLDPVIARPPLDGWASSRAVIDACRPFQWREKFPKVTGVTPEVVAKARQKFPELYLK